MCSTDVPGYSLCIPQPRRANPEARSVPRFGRPAYRPRRLGDPAPCCCCCYSSVGMETQERWLRPVACNSAQKCRIRDCIIRVAMPFSRHLILRRTCRCTAPAAARSPTPRVRDILSYPFAPPYFRWLCCVYSSICRV